MYVARLPPSFISVIEVQNVNYNHDLVTAYYRTAIANDSFIKFCLQSNHFPEGKNKICAGCTCSLAAI